MQVEKPRHIATVTVPHPAVRAPEPPPILALLGAVLAPFVVMLIVALILAAIKDAITPPPAPPAGQIAPPVVAAPPPARPPAARPHALAFSAPLPAGRVRPWTPSATLLPT